MFVGGEFYYDEKWQLDTPQDPFGGALFLNGGKACLTVIADSLLDQGIDRVLLPAYLCPTIVDTLEGCGLACSYYRLNRDLSIDLDNLLRQAVNCRAIYFINYFGFQHSAATRDFLAERQSEGWLLIEDNALAGFPDETLGDYVFNSLRKLCPFDGGYLRSRFDLKPFMEDYHGLPNHRLPLIRAYRNGLADYLFHGRGKREQLVELYEQAEKVYVADRVVEGDEGERLGIERLDWTAIRSVRRRNYNYLLSLLEGVEGITPIFPALQEDNLPMGLPVYVSGVPRDWLFDELGNAGIGLTVHWEGILSDARLNRDALAVEMAGRMLNLVIDQRTSLKQLDYLAQKIRESLENYKGNP